MDLQKVLYDLIEPLVDDKEALSIQERESLNENEIILVVYANSNDIGRLIGRKGVMAQALRNVMGIAGRINERRINIQFESY